jgi:hypothetical protein
MNPGTVCPISTLQTNYLPTWQPISFPVTSNYRTKNVETADNSTSVNGRAFKNNGAGLSTSSS